jgi:hypothetical protein
VAPDKPGPGAGRIGTKGALDRYTFTAESGTIVYLKAEPPCNSKKNKLTWEIYTGRDADARSSWAVLAKGTVCRNDGYFTVPARGTYNITVYGFEDWTGDYGFALQTAPADNMPAFKRLHHELFEEATRSDE